MEHEGAIKIGIIGGSGLYSMPGLEQASEVQINTPFGEPSDAFVVGILEGKRVAFLARHARGHRLLPGEINYRANIYAMKLLGVERILSISAVGSLRESLHPLDFLIRINSSTELEAESPHSSAKEWWLMLGSLIPHASSFPHGWPIRATERK